MVLLAFLLGPKDCYVRLMEGNVHTVYIYIYIYVTIYVYNRGVFLFTLLKIYIEYTRTVFFFQSYFFDSNFPFSNSGNCLPQKGYSTVPNTDPR